MNEATQPPMRFVSEHAAANDDTVLPFQVDALDVRGRTIQLGEALDTLLERHAYPPAVARILGEATVLTGLLGTALKFEGRFQLQTRTDGPIDLLVVDFEAPDRIRGYARFDQGRVEETVRHARADASLGSQLLGNGHLGLTLDQGTHMNQYQGIVALEGQDLEEAAHQYFRQSEQIPTRIRLAVGEVVTGNAEKTHSWRGGGVLVQFLPTSLERQRQPDFDPGDAPEGVAQSEFVEDDAWTEARSLVETVEDHELIDPSLSSERLLYRLFHERGVRVFDAVPVREACRCSEPRIREMLNGFSAEERQAMVADDGTIGVTCEFCSKHYSFDPAEFAAPLDLDVAQPE